MAYYETSSSSLCGCYLCEAGMDCRDIQPTPFYPSTGQPFVYFCDVPDNNSKQKKRTNFFKRAFRWYTDDLQPKKERCCDPPNVGGFATWLDAKYEQFLKENEDSDKPTQTSVEDCCDENICPPPCTPETQASDTCDPSCKKKRKFGRIKSPRKKRRDKSKSKERKSADDVDKHSMEFILPPKDISRAASDCCHASPTSCDSDRQRLVAKSQSLTSITVTKDGKVIEEYVKSVIFDNPPVEQKSNKSLHSSATRTLKREKVAFNDACCQCCVSSDDAQTQYEISKTTCEVSREPTRLNSPSCCSSCACSTESKTKDKKKKKRREVSKKRSKKDLKDSKKDSKESQSKESHRSLNKSSKSDVSCQCNSAEKADAVVQCLNEPKDDPQNDNTAKCITVGGTKICTQISQNPPPTSQQNVIITTPFVTQEPVGRCSADCGYFAKKVVTQQSTQCHPECTPRQHTQAQTSDLTINIDPNAINGYPLFMKIVCRDRLTDDRVFVVK